MALYCSKLKVSFSSINLGVLCHQRNTRAKTFECIMIRSVLKATSDSGSLCASHVGHIDIHLAFLDDSDSSAHSAGTSVRFPVGSAIEPTVPERERATGKDANRRRRVKAGRLSIFIAT